MNDVNVTEGNNVTFNNINITDAITVAIDIIESSTSGFNITDNTIIDNTSDINDGMNVTTASPVISMSSGRIPAFYMTLMSVVGPGVLAHSLAAYCLAHDIRRKMPLLKQLLVALCVIDVLGLCSVAIHHWITSFVTNASKSLCSFNSFFSCFLPLMSGALTTLMAAERCVKFRAPFFWHSVNFGTWKMKLPIVITTLILMVISLFPLSGLGYIMSQDGKRRCLTFPTSVPRMYNSPEGIYAISYSTVGLTTVFVDVSCNIAVMITLIRTRNKRAVMSESAEGKNAEMAMTRMLFCLSATFLITLAPLYVSVVLMYAGISPSVTVKSVTHALAGLNFTLDPFIYIFMMKSYRRRLRNLFCCCLRRKKDAVGSSGNSYQINASTANAN